MSSKHVGRDVKDGCLWELSEIDSRVCILNRAFLARLLLGNPVEAILAEPLVDFHDLFLGQVIEVVGALRMEPATIDAVFLLLAHDEVACG